MHTYLPKVFCFVDDFNKDYIKNLDKKIAIIFRNYDQKHSTTLLKQLCKFCKKIGKRVFLANEKNYHHNRYYCCNWILY